MGARAGYNAAWPGTRAGVERKAARSLHGGGEGERLPGTATAGAVWRRERSLVAAMSECRTLAGRDGLARTIAPREKKRRIEIERTSTGFWVCNQWYGG